ncbi:Uma2 family endonuclease [Yinghuangia seranimata]|uniref:Uma2 family endonuclease n=1 Tax=Yinghuangia seranimata TaxID=408067 RepID=UPI00248D38D7|nr:Uma2 family endonuclease [Yinghuangia seranimata]MDI2127013.1 Uma2 family endonuclease [Yinghuangia seranimata]
MTLLEEARVAADTGASEAAKEADVVAAFDTFDPPEGFRAELIGGKIVLSPTSVGLHGGLLRRLTRLFLEERLPSGTEATTYPLTVWLPETPDGKEGYIPDLAVIDEDVMWDADHWKFTADVIHLVVEVVSSSSKQEDRIHKPCGYASGPVPLYLLIDPVAGETTLFSDPKDGEYRTRHTAPFGGKIPFPEPFDAVLDTSIFIR